MEREEGSSTKERGRQRESKRMAEKNICQIFLRMLEIRLKCFCLFVCVVIYRFSTYYLGWTKLLLLSPVLPVFCLCPHAWAFFVCVSTPKLIIIIIITFVSFISLVICISNKFACKNQHLQWYLDRQANRCTVRWIARLFVCLFVCRFFRFYHWRWEFFRSILFLNDEKKTVSASKRYV